MAEGGREGGRGRVREEGGRKGGREGGKCRELGCALELKRGSTRTGWVSEGGR